MVNPTRLLKTFKITDENLNTNAPIKEAYKSYKEKRFFFSEARKDLSDAISRLHDVLDEPLRSTGHVPDGKDWALKEDEAGGLCIYVMAEPKQRGRKKPDVPIEKVSFPVKGPKAA